jgi:hypothetical protein
MRAISAALSNVGFGEYNGHPNMARMSASGGKADMTYCGSFRLMSAE